MKLASVFTALALLLGLAAPAMAEDKPAEPKSEKAHVHKDGDSDKHDKKEAKDEHGHDHDHKDGDNHKDEPKAK